MTHQAEVGLRGGWRAGWELLWPVRCAGCDRPGVAICERCRAAVAGPAFFTPLVGWPPGWGAWAACAYGGAPARLLNAWKERGRTDLTRPLSVGLAAAVRACRAAAADGVVLRVGSDAMPGPGGGDAMPGPGGGDAMPGPGGGDAMPGPGGADAGSGVVDRIDAAPWVLVPMPTTRAARRRRGGDLMAELAAHAARACRADWPGPPPRPVPALHHVRRVQDQAGLGATGRRGNLRGALAVRPGAVPLVAGRNCLVLDDVVTTGTTAAEAARALTSVGARVVGACFLSVTLRRQEVLEEG